MTLAEGWSIFQSTPSPRRETADDPYFQIIELFQSTPSPRRETQGRENGTQREQISIHSLPKEGDINVTVKRVYQRNFNPLPPQGGRQLDRGYYIDMAKFQSTPSPRRETLNFGFGYIHIFISIHSLPKEGDSQREVNNVGKRISIHSLPKEGDRCS